LTLMEEVLLLGLKDKAVGPGYKDMLMPGILIILERQYFVCAAGMYPN